MQITEEMARAIISELSDILRMRIAEFTPVTDGYRAVIMGHTLKALALLEKLAGHYNVDISVIKEKILEEVRLAGAAGRWIDESV